MNTVTDYKERKRALTPDESFIVQAPAGSGKTELLIQRYLNLLSQVEHPEEIVAITFTRKAAAEMQGRIVNALVMARAKYSPEDDTTRITLALAEKVIQQDEKFGWRLACHPGRLRIQTIDALCALLTRQMPILSRFGAQPQTVDDASGLYEQAAANTLGELESGEGWSNAIAVLLSHLDNDLPKVRDMLANMLARRYQWLRHVAGKPRREELETGLKHLVEDTLERIRKNFPRKFMSELIALLHFAADNLVKEDTPSPVRECKDIDQLPGYAVEDLSRWQGIAHFLLKKDGWRKQARNDIGFPAAGNNKVEGDTRKAMKDRFAVLMSNLSDDETLFNLLMEVRFLPPVAYKDSEWQVVDALCQLLILADAQLRILFAERNQTDFSGIEHAAIRALGTPEEPTDLALHMDYRIMHLLVDEFQDISFNQLVLLQLLTAGWSAGDGHTLFLVGDPMQSIYRFREADVAVFLNTWQELRLGQVALTPLTITLNFRSQRGIVEWVNNTFRELLPALSDVDLGAVNYAGTEAFHDTSTGTAVRIHPLFKRNDLAEADTVVQLVNAARQDDPDGKVAILVRNRNHLTEIAPGLRKAGLRFRAVEIEGLGQRPAIQDLLALTRALNHVADRIAWLAILRAPWCGLTLLDLYALAGEDKRTIWEIVLDDARILSLSKDGQTRLMKLRHVLQQTITDERRRTLRRSVESTWVALGGPATLQDESDLENAQTFFDLLDQFDEGGELKNPDHFMKAVALLYAVPDVSADDKLQIMTIHKAKGLEFDTVILPALGRGKRQDEPSLLLWTERPHKAGQDLILAPIKKAGEDESPLYEYLRRVEKKKQYYEDGRLLYVAATRAKKQLHLIGSVDVLEKDGVLQFSNPRSDSLLAQLWPAVKDTFEAALENYTPVITPEEEVTVINSQLRRLTSDWTLPVAPDAVKWQAEKMFDQEEDTVARIEFEWAGEVIMHIGTVVHRCIQWMAEEGIETWDRKRIQSKRSWYKSSLKRLGVPEKEIELAVASVEEALTKMIQDKRGQWLLMKEHKDQHNEYALSGLYQGRIVNIKIDRTFVDEKGIRWVVDYKTGRHEGQDVNAFLDQEKERYQDQLKKYGDLIRNMDNKPIKLGLYYPLLQGWREWEYK
ncbi:MAG: UvrD-helicase domain-containing protein [Gammaproteobacteria bacterium]|nr:UvrD-helicase domain-containing protein [Gammaproteobacteria bacterium]